MKHLDELTLFEYLRGESAEREVEPHLRECPMCSARAGQLQTLTNALGAQLPYSEQFQDRLLSKVQTPADAALVSKLREWLLPALQLACAVSLLVLRFSSDTGVDVSSVLLSGMPSTAATEDLSPSISDPSLAFGIPMSGS